MTVDASLLHPITGQCPPILWRRLATLPKVSTRGVATDTYSNVRGGMIVVGHAVGAWQPHKPTHLRVATASSATAWTRSDLDADGQAAATIANEFRPCPGGQSITSVIDDCPARAVAMQAACVRPGCRVPVQRRATARIQPTPQSHAQQLPLRLGMPLNLPTTPFAERALGP